MFGNLQNVNLIHINISSLYTTKIQNSINWHKYFWHKLYSRAFPHFFFFAECMPLLISWTQIFNLSSYDPNDGICGKKLPDVLCSYSFLSRHGQKGERVIRNTATILLDYRQTVCLRRQHYQAAK